MYLLGSFDVPPPDALPISSARGGGRLDHPPLLAGDCDDALIDLTRRHHSVLGEEFDIRSFALTVNAIITLLNHDLVPFRIPESATSKETNNHPAWPTPSCP